MGVVEDGIAGGAPPSCALLEPTPLPPKRALVALLACAVRVLRLLVRRELHQPAREVGTVLRFADGTSGRVFRVTTRDVLQPAEPALLVVGFRLRGVRHEWQHAVFRVESVCNTLLFAGFPGFVSKRWVDHDERGVYRGVYQWDGAARAAAYVGALWWVLAAVSARGSIHAVIAPGLVTDEVLESPGLLARVLPGGDEWWRFD